MEAKSYVGTIRLYPKKGGSDAVKTDAERLSKAFNDAGFPCEAGKFHSSSWGSGYSIDFYTVMADIERAEDILKGIQPMNETGHGEYIVLRGNDVFHKSLKLAM